MPIWGDKHDMFVDEVLDSVEFKSKWKKERFVNTDIGDILVYLQSTLSYVPVMCITQCMSYEYEYFIASIFTI